MSRELRRVPLDWQHPQDERGYHVPLHDGAQLAESTAYFEDHEVEWREKYGPDLGGETRPDPTDYTPVWSTDEAVGWCIYETVSEGTPWSPVFAEPEALQRWLVEEQGYRPEAAAAFLVNGWAPSFVMHGDGEIQDGIASSTR